MKRALVVQTSLGERGGGGTVAAWAIEALRADFDVTLLAWSGADLDSVNDAFGTTLDNGDFRLALVPAAWRAGLRWAPIPLALLRMGLLQAQARKLLAREQFDLVLGTANEIDIGVRAIQYVHFPWTYYPRPDVDYRWYHLRPLLLLYRSGVERLLGVSLARIARNRTLVNSAWTGRRFQAWYGVPARVLHPPVPVDEGGLPWPAREERFICIGRIAPEKRILEMIGILSAVRRRGHAVSLLICGQRYDRSYESRVRAAAAAGDWITLALDLPRRELVARAAASRFGIHGMVGEHFGIAIAEMMRLGCVVFAPREGGAPEILGDEPRLLYGSDEEAIDRICAVIEDRRVLGEVRDHLRSRSGLFSAERFVRELRAICAEFVEGPGADLNTGRAG